MSFIKSGRCGAAVIALACLCPAAFAQGGEAELDRKIAELKQHYEQRLDSLRADYEERLKVLERKAEGVDADQALEDSINTLIRQEEPRRGLGDFSQTTLFDNTFNPAVAVVGDFLLAVSDRDDTYETLDQFILRSLEIAIAGRVDPYVAYFVAVHFDEEDVELEEAYGVWDDGMPDTFTLKGGRYNVDFGKLSPIHDHDLPFVDKPQVLQEYVGGSLRGTGLELHHWLPIGESHLVRWSAGIVNSLDGDAHPVFGPLAGAHDHGHGHEGEEEVEPFGERDIENFAFTARVTGLFELGSESTLQVGASVAWAPEERAFFEIEGGSRSGKGKHVVDAEDLERLVFGADATFSWLDPSTGRGLTLRGEFLLSDADFLEEHDEEGGGGGPEVLRDITSIGFYAYAEWFFNQNWSIGASGGWFEHAEDDDLDSWDAGAFVTWRVNEFNRLRLEGRYFEDPDEDYWGIMLQWTVILGSHGHGIDW